MKADCRADRTASEKIPEDSLLFDGEAGRGPRGCTLWSSRCPIPHGTRTALGIDKLRLGPPDGVGQAWHYRGRMIKISHETRGFEWRRRLSPAAGGRHRRDIH